jgi:poly(A) polymerase
MPTRLHPPYSLAQAPWLRAPETRAVLDALKAAGFEARVVGGAVRNTLLARPVADIDIATTALPEQTITAAKAAGLKTIPTGLQHGTITVIADHVPFEVTTLRTDVETDGRHARVAFTADWAADAGRRDFTINALYCDASGTIQDPIGGLTDIEPPRIRFIGDATARIREDYLRILRFFRFTAEYTDGTLDTAGLAACEAERTGLARISSERIQVELLKLLVAPNAQPVLVIIHARGFLRELLGDEDTRTHSDGIHVFARIIEIEKHLQSAPCAILRLAALLPQPVEGGAIDALAKAVATRLRLSNADRDFLLSAVTPAIGHTPVPNANLARAALHAGGAARFQARVLLAWAHRQSAPTDAPDWTSLYRLPERWTPPVFPLSGDDLIAAGLSPGPDLGAQLDAMQAWWYDHGLEPDRQTVLAELERRLQEAQQSGTPTRG